jgi:hypothetical protein
MRLSILAFILCIPAIPTRTLAATWRVTPHPLQDEGLVAAAVDSASSGDTILIDPGTYYEHIDLHGKSLTFLGNGASRSAILDGSRDPVNSVGSILYNLGGNGIEVHVQGLTFRHGQGTPWGYLHQVVGGAIALVDPLKTEAGTSLLAEDCAFESNILTAMSSEGGAILIFEGNLDIDHCSFEGNAAQYGGGTISGGDVGRVSVRNSQFTLEIPAYSGVTGISFMPVGEFLMDHCTMTSRTGPGPSPGDGIAIWTEKATITSSTFIDPQSFLATNIKVYEPYDPYEGTIPVLFADNVVINGTGSVPGGVVELGPMNGVIDLERNTFSGCYVWTDVAGGSAGSSTVCGQNIFYRCQVSLGGRSSQVSCNCAWPDSLGTAPNRTLIDNVWKDPRFCDPAQGDLRLADTSPCTAEHAPGGCGLIGALGVACGDTPVEIISWGRLKARYLPRK